MSVPALLLCYWPLRPSPVLLRRYPRLRWDEIRRPPLQVIHDGIRR